MKLLEAYLRQATGGLIGKKRLEIREELTAHLLERAHKYEIAGLTHADALARAIKELGDAQTIRAGMIGVHTMPKIYANTGLAAVLAAGIIATLSVSSAQVIGTMRTPIAQCADTSVAVIALQTPLGGRVEKFPCDGNGVWLNASSLRTILEPLGVILQTQTAFTITLPPANKPELIRLSDEFVHSSTLVESLRSLLMTFTMSRWDNPVLKVGATRFQIGSSNVPIRGEVWYRSVLETSLQKLSNGWGMETVQTDSIKTMERLTEKYGIPLWCRSYTHRIKTDFAAGQIVVVASREPTRTIEYKGKATVMPAVTRTYIAPVGKDGILEYPSDAKTLRFKDDLRSLSLTPKDGAGDIAVLKFTSDLSFNKKSFELVPSSKLSK